MILTVFERACLLSILPVEGNFKTLRTIRKMREEISLSEEEIKIYEPRMAEGRMEWKTIDDDGKPIPQEADIGIGQIGAEIITERLRHASDEGHLRMEHFTLYEKFITEAENGDTD
jgi:hypothetical protein